LTSQANEIQPIKLIIIFRLKKENLELLKELKKQIDKFVLTNEDLKIVTN